MCAAPVPAKVGVRKDLGEGREKRAARFEGLRAHFEIFLARRLPLVAAGAPRGPGAPRDARRSGKGGKRPQGPTGTIRDDEK